MTKNVLRMPKRRAVADDNGRAALLQDLLCAFHIMDLTGQPSGMGSHLTARLPGGESFFFHIHNFGFGEVTPGHIHEADFDLNVLTGDVDINPTLHIHTRIYLARPDVTCIVHTHAKHVSALSAIGANLLPLTQSAARFHDECVFYDENNSVALGTEPGAAMARALEHRSAMVLKNHGLLTVGKTIPEAVVLADSMEKEAEIQLLAMAAGEIDLPSIEERERSKAYVRSELMVERAWAYMMRRLARERSEILEM